MGVDVIEAGFPGASAGEHEAVRAVAECVRRARVCGLSRAIPAEVDRTWLALRGARTPRIHVFLSSSEIHLAHQLHRGADEVVEMARAAVERARGYTDDVEWSCMDATRSNPELIARLVRVAIGAGATTINLPDTVGCARPDQVAAMFRELQARVPEASGVVLSFHGQDDLGMATANSLAAISAGARQVEVAVNGLGERAGNTAFEEVVMALRVHGEALGVETGVDTRGIWAVSQAVARRSGIRGSAQQGDRRRKRLPPRLGHPPGRRAEVPRDVRGGRPGRDRASQSARRSCSASYRAARASRRACARWESRPRTPRSSAPSPASRSSRTAGARSPTRSWSRSAASRTRARGRRALEPGGRWGTLREMAIGADVIRRALGSVLRNARYSALFLLAGSEALIVEWCLRAATGRSLGLAAGAGLVVALAVLNVATLALLPRLARSTTGGYRLGRLLAGRQPRRAD